MTDETFDPSMYSPPPSWAFGATCEVCGKGFETMHEWNIRHWHFHQDGNDSAKAHHARCCNHKENQENNK